MSLRVIREGVEWQRDGKSPRPTSLEFPSGAMDARAHASMVSSAPDNASWQCRLRTQ